MCVCVCVTWGDEPSLFLSALSLVGRPFSFRSYVHSLGHGVKSARTVYGDDR